MKKTIFLFLLCTNWCWVNVLKAQAPAPPVLAWRGEGLLQVKLSLQQPTSPYREALDQLVAAANKALQFGPVSVVEKTILPPSGDRHDYISLAPYYWPDPQTKDGLPYVRKDGETNPEVKKYKDKEYLPELCEQVFVLGLAYYFTGNDAYVLHGQKLLQVWFLDTATRMNPNLNFAQYIKGVNTGRGAGLIDTRHLVKLIDGVQLLQTSALFSPTALSGLKTWFGRFLDWMQTSKNGKEEMAAKNNHGVWYDAQRLSFALFTGQNKLAQRIVDNVQLRMGSQMDEAGFFPAELVRTISLHYSLFVLEPFFHIGFMGEKINRNFFAYKAPNGNHLAKGFNALLPYLLHQQKWTYPQIKPFDDRESIPVLGIASQLFNCTDCTVFLSQLMKDKPNDKRIQLLTAIHF